MRGREETPNRELPAGPVLGGSLIPKRDVQHWMTALSLSDARERSRRSDGSPLQQAVRFLITLRWMIGEAHQRKLGVGKSEVDSALQLQEGAYTTRSEFTGLLKESAERLRTSGSNSKPTLAFAALRRALAPGEAKTMTSSHRVRARFLARWRAGGKR